MMPRLASRSIHSQNGLLDATSAKDCCVGGMLVVKLAAFATILLVWPRVTFSAGRNVPSP